MLCDVYFVLRALRVSLAARESEGTRGYLWVSNFYLKKFIILIWIFYYESKKKIWS